MAKEEITPEKIEAARALNVKSTLERKLFMGVLGHQLVLTNQVRYGTENTKSREKGYREITSGDEFKKVREDEYSRKMEEMNRDGVYGEPSIPSDGEVSHLIMRQVRGVMERFATVGELEKYAKSVGAKIDEVPEKLRRYKFEDFEDEFKTKNAVNEKGEIDLSKVSPEVAQAYILHRRLSNEYENACALRVVVNGSSAETNALIRKLQEECAPKEEPKK